MGKALLSPNEIKKHQGSMYLCQQNPNNPDEAIIDRMFDQGSIA